MNPILTYVLSSADGQYSLTKMPDTVMKSAVSRDADTLVIDPRISHQPILGFGGTWTDTDVYNLLRMSPDRQNEVLTALLDPEKGAGWNFMRLPFGSTDWESTTDYYTYDDMPLGEKDWDLTHFSIQRDIDRGLFDLARRCKAINPDVVFLGSVWGVPGWMKENDSIMFGRFDPACTKVYARYLRMTVQAFEKEGVHLLAVTPQNESLTSDDRATPACRFTWRMQKDVIIALRKEFDEHGIDTEIWVYDHNFDMARNFVEPMLADPEARNALDAVAFHDYGGSPREMGRLADMYPDVPFYLTERLIGTVPEMDHLIQEFLNGSRSYIQWTTMCNEYGGPHQFLGLTPGWNHSLHSDSDMHSGRTAIYNLLDEPDTWFKTHGYYLYGQFTKYLKRGMVRVDCTCGDQSWVTAAAFRDPETKEIVCVLVNQTALEQSLVLRCAGFEAPLTLPAMSVATCLLTAEGEPFSVSDADQRAVFSEPAFDLEPKEIFMEGNVNAGSEILFSCRVRNVGNLPTRENATVMVQFSLDGDCHIARGTITAPAIAPGEDIIVKANVPCGKKRTWTAEAGWHNIFAFVSIGNCLPEKNWDNNRMGIEIFVP